MDDSFRVKASYRLFDDLSCCSTALNVDLNDHVAVLALLDENKMRCHIINCVVALNMVLMQRDNIEGVLSKKKCEAVKKKIFNTAITMMIGSEVDSDYPDIKTVIAAFPDESKMNDERSWLPMHFAIALSVRNSISEDDLHILLSTDPLAMHRLSSKEDEDDDDDDDDVKPLIGCSPAHLLCMRKQPKMSLVRYFCLRDPRAFALRDQSGRCALHLAAQYSESLELLQEILQIDSKMTKAMFSMQDIFHRQNTTPLGLICRRLEFPSFDKMVLCLIEADSSVEVIHDGIICSYDKYDNSLHQDISPGSRGEKILTLIQNLLNANPTVMKYNGTRNIFHEACSKLKGQLGIAVLSLLLTHDSTAVKSVGNGYLPIHLAALNSCLDVLKFLHKLYPESISMLDEEGQSLLHLATLDNDSNCAAANIKVQYLCDQCPALIYLKDNDGYTPLHTAVCNLRLNYEGVKILCNVDRTVVREKFNSGQLPLLLLILYRCGSGTLEVSDLGDYFRLILSLYPAAAGIEDDGYRSPYDWARIKGMKSYFRRILLLADPTIDPVERRNLNYTARRQGMFLAFRALSRNKEPTIWAKLRYEDRNLLERVISYL
jgi:ankyrin repeat protein